MDDRTYQLISKLVPSSYVKQAENAKRTRQGKIQLLLEQKKLPERAWDDPCIEEFVRELAMMDSNNFPGNCGVGEREARIYSNLVASRHFRFGHGIGRSGDLVETQPKAAGSSLLNVIVNSMARDAIRMTGISSTESCLVVPVATGMALTLCMLTLRQQRPKAKYVLWTRIDQKSCFKSMIAAGFEPIVIENVFEGDELRTDLNSLNDKLRELKSENILCIFSTTSCFAPRAPDKLEEIAKICKDNNVPHLINNAYGLQSSKCTHLIQQASRVGRIDAFVQSTDKNFMVPVGGSIVAGFDKEFISNVSKIYPGRASSSPSLDLFITFLSLGADGLRNCLSERKKIFVYLKEQLNICAEAHGEKLLHTPNNTISLAISLRTLSRNGREAITKLGSMLFTRCISGTRVVAPGDTKVINEITFENFGSHSARTTCPYLTAAASVGMTRIEVDIFISKLNKVLGIMKKSSSELETVSLLDSIELEM